MTSQRMLRATVWDEGGRTVRWRFARGVVCGVGVVLLAGVLGGCGHGARAQPETPPEAVKVVVEGMRENRPEVLWEALPASYQADVRSLVGTFCDEFDRDLYDRAFRILNKGVRVLKEKESFLFNSPVALSMPMLEAMMGERRKEVVRLLEAIATSEVSSLERLRGMDPGAFLATTGRQVMEAGERMRRQMQRSAGPNPWERVEQAIEAARMEFEASGADRGWLRFRGTTNAVMKDVELARVEGRWVPAEMAAEWSRRVGEAKERLAKLSGPEFEKAKPMVALGMGMVETAIDRLLAASTQKEFDEVLKGMAAIGALFPGGGNRAQ